MQWIGGFEGADHVTGSGMPLSMARDAGGRLDFRSLHARMRAAQRQGIEIRWTLMHYGTPADLDVLDGDFAPAGVDRAQGVSEMCDDAWRIVSASASTGAALTHG